MIAQDEIAIRRHDDIGIRARIGVNPRHVWFVDGFAVNVHSAGVDANVVASQTDYSLNETFRGVTWITKDDDISARDRLDSIDELINEDPLLVLERRHHGGAFDLHGLVQEDNDEARDSQGDNQIPQPNRDYYRS